MDDCNSGSLTGTTTIRYELKEKRVIFHNKEVPETRVRR
jgi:hypothetical protein